jgi:hypothetical protein
MILLSNSGSIIIDNQNCNTSELIDVTKKIYNEIFHLEKYYPNFKEWYFNKVTNGIIEGNRSFIIEIRDCKIAGISILKDTEKEKKICTLFVSDEYKSKGLGIKLFERSMKMLNTDKPLASVSEDRLKDFERIFNYFNFNLSNEYQDLYLPNKKEFSFNGYIN